MPLTFLKTDGCRIVKQEGRVTLVVTKEHENYSIWVDNFIVSECGVKNSMQWFNDWIKKVNSGEYDDSEHGKRHAQLARQQNTPMGKGSDSAGVDYRGAEMAFGTEAATVAVWLCIL